MNSRIAFTLTVFVVVTLATLLSRHRLKRGKIQSPWNTLEIRPLSDVGRRDLLKAQIDQRWELYDRERRQLERNLQLQVVFIVLGVAVGISSIATLKVPSLEVDIPGAWFFFAAPAALFYLWAKFGHLLNSLIQNRVAICAGFEVFGEDFSSQHFDRRTLLHDRGLLDLYFLRFHPRFHGIKEASPWLNNVYLWLYAAVIGAGHAVILGMSYLGLEAQLHLVGWSGLTWWFLAQTCVLGLLLPLTHYQFIVGGRNPNWVQLVVAFWTVALTAVLLHYATPATERALASPGAAATTAPPRPVPATTSP